MGLPIEYYTWKMTDLLIYCLLEGMVTLSVLGINHYPSC